MVLVVVLLAFAAGACSGGGGGSSNASSGAACPLVKKLDDIVAGIPRETLSDPTAFRGALDDAVKEYADTVRQLKRAVPANLHGDLDRVESDVKQYRFPDAVTHRASLDAYAARACARPLTSSSVSSATTTTLAGA
jgi:hypothetical protein